MRWTGTINISRSKLIVSFAILCFVSQENRPNRSHGDLREPRSIDAYGKLPINFEVNEGQADPDVKFLARGNGYTVLLSPADTSLLLNGSLDGEGRSTALRMKWLGANRELSLRGREPLPGKANYFIGNDPSAWRTNIPTYGSVEYDSVYPGINLVFHTSNSARELEYDFEVGPRTNPDEIRFTIEGADRMELDAQGNLLLYTNGREIQFRKPDIYQEVAGKHESITGGYILGDAQEVGFRVGAYDSSRPLIIDPVLAYSTYLSDSVDIFGVTVDSNGSAYLTGYLIGPKPGAIDRNVFIAKLNPAGSAFVYEAYVGGASDDTGYSIAVDSSGNAFVTGSTESLDFPVVKPYQPGKNGGINVFVFKASADASSIFYSTYLGGEYQDKGFGIAVDSTGSAYVTGQTTSARFPLKNAFQQTYNAGNCCAGIYQDAFITKFNPAGNDLVYSTYIGGGANDTARHIALDSSGNAYIVGYTTSSAFPTKNAAQSGNRGSGDAFVTVLNAAGSALVYSTYLGGRSDDHGEAIAVDASGNAYITGYTPSTDFPTKVPYQSAIGGGQDAFVAAYSATGSVIYSTYLGGNAEDSGEGIVVDAAGNAWVTGYSKSANFPQASAVQNAIAGSQNAIITKFSPGGTSLAFSTYFGGNGQDAGQAIALDAAGNIYIAGSSTSTNFPLLSPVQTKPNTGGAGFLFKLAASFEPALTKTLAPGFYIVEATLAPGAQSGFWGMTVLLSGGQAAGGFNLGGALFPNSSSPSFGAFALASPQTVTATLNAQPPGGTFLTMRLLDANNNNQVIGGPVTSAPPVTLSSSLQPGFYIVEAYSPASSAVTYQLGLNANTFSGGVNTGGYLTPGVVGFGAFYVAQSQSVSMKLLGQAAYGTAGAGDIKLTLKDSNGNVIQTVP